MTHNDEIVKVQIDQELYDELTDAVHDFHDENIYLRTEIEYLKDYVSWMNLDDSYINFRRNAKRTFKNEDDPFGRYTL